MIDLAKEEAFALATNSVSQKTKDHNSKIVIFSITDAGTKKKMDYGVDIGQVQEIGSIEEVTRVPGAPLHVKGVMNLRGKIITIVDMKRLLGFASLIDAANAFSTNDRIIVAQVGMSVIGLLVDEVDQVVEVSPSDIESAPTVLSETAPYIKGIVKLNGNLYVLLDLQLLLANENSPTGNNGSDGHSTTSANGNDYKILENADSARMQSGHMKANGEAQ
jgi:purine-binding chemotaxis protein CheW